MTTSSGVQETATGATDGASLVTSFIVELSLLLDTNGEGDELVSPNSVERLSLGDTLGSKLGTCEVVGAGFAVEGEEPPRLGDALLGVSSFAADGETDCRLALSAVGTELGIALGKLLTDGLKVSSPLIPVSDGDELVPKLPLERNSLDDGDALPLSGMSIVPSLGS